MITKMHRHPSKHAGSTVATALAALSFVALSPTASSADAPGVARGRYLVRTAGCNDCHTPGYMATAGKVDEAQWLTGDHLGWQGPWGTTYPPNLRLALQRYTLDEWLRAARLPRRPPMPWFALRDMTDEDLSSIYRYIRSLGPAGTEAPAFIPPGQKAPPPVVAFPQG
jgi:mono/diheme cytochrome c family protein